MCESVSDWGDVVCAACPNNSTIITAGTSTVVCVWDVSISKDKLKHMRLKQVRLTRVIIPKQPCSCLGVTKQFEIEMIHFNIL